MDRWTNKIAVVTGASAGVGAAVALQLANNGLIVIGVARRLEKVQQLIPLVKGAAGKIIAMEGDVSKEEDIKRIFAAVEEKFGTIHVLVNNAGSMVAGTILDGKPSDWQKTLDLNVVGVATCAKEAIRIMRKSEVDGYIININSTLGRSIPPTPNPFFNIYPSSKFAVTALSEVLRQEIQAVGSKIRVTNLCPGLIKTDFITAATANVPEYQETLPKFLESAPALEASDLADAIQYLLSAPPHVQVHELVLAGL